MSFDKVLTKVFGSSNERFLKAIRPTIAQINEFEPAVQALSDDQMRARTAAFKEQIANAVKDARDKDDRKRLEQDALNEILPEAFALVREASKRTTGMLHFDEQMIGGIVLHQGKIAEMRTGEGKTLVATLPAYLNALTGRGVHVVTVNDYLALRDAEWMGQIYRFLDLTVGCIQNDMDDFERQAAYAADITYGTNNEFGFDYLRDNMKFDLGTCVQRGHYHAIVDEVDSILIDEARTPLIISGPSEESTDKYYHANAIIPLLQRGEELEEGKKTGDYIVDEKNHSAVLTEEGVDKAERLLGVGNLYDPSNMELLHCVEQALKAHTLYRLNHQYVVQNGEVIIVDDSTGRLMNGRRWSDGLHQAVEAKERVRIERENQTLATVTLQNYFRLYEKLSGMTGTAETEAGEFHSTYKLEVIVIPTHMPMVRKDFPDVIYRTLPEKWEAIVEEIKECHAKGQPVLVGTVAVENSELISRFLKKAGIPHNVLNAKYHELEAELVAQAGRKGAVTISTNMAGRGTDIILGGNPGSMGALLFSVIDFLDARSLVRKLVFGGDSPPPSAYLNSKFSSSTQQLLAACVTFSQPEQLAKALVADLNILIRDPSLYDPTQFESIVLGPETEELIRQTSNEGSSRFWADKFVSDFIDALGLARKLANKEEPLSQYLYQYLYSVSLLFGVDDLLDTQSLVGKLAAKKDSLSAYLHSKLTANTQNLLAAGSSSGQPDERLVKALVTDLNVLLRSPSLYDQEQFAAITLQPETKYLLTQNPTNDELIRLNRLLLEDAYPEIAKNLYRQLDNSIEAGKSSKELLNALVIAFNKLSTGPSLFDQERFRGVTLRDETRQLLERSPKGNELGRLNRLLLEDAYPLEIANTRDKLVRLNRLVLQDAYQHEIAKKQEGELLFSVSDFLDVQSVARKLVIRGDSPSAYLHSKLTSNTQELLKECLTFSRPDESLVKALGIQFNILLKGSSLYDQRQFASIDLRPKTKEQLAKKNPIGNELVYLNRLLLEDAYPDEIAKTTFRLDDSNPNPWQEYAQHTKNIATLEHEEVVKLGGLHILGTERHEARRIDNQLRGRSGRQGDPGSSRFFLSLEDDLMRIFAGDKVKALMQRLGMEKGVAIESKMVSKRIAAAQKSVEGRNFETRKHLLEYDDVMNKQRETIYGLRRQLMEEPDQREYLVGDTGVARDLLADTTKQYLNPDVSEHEWDIENYKVKIHSIYALDADAEGIDLRHASSEEIEEQIWEKLKVKYADKEKQIGEEAMRTYERIIMLNIIDAQWKDHLLALDHLKQGIGLVGYGQKDPLVEYKKESFDMFQAMLDRIDTTTIRSLFNLQVVAEQAPDELQRRRAARRASMNFTGPNQGAAAAGEEAGKVKTVVRSEPKVGRNDPCPCGSGKKYKKCHGIA